MFFWFFFQGLGTFLWLSRFRDKMSLPLTLVPFSWCVSFCVSEPRARLLGGGGFARAIDSLTWWGSEPLSGMTKLYDFRSVKYRRPEPNCLCLIFIHI